MPGRPDAADSAQIDPAVAYGPDDPGYGPPGPDWYKRNAGDESNRDAGNGFNPEAGNVFNRDHGNGFDRDAGNGFSPDAGNGSQRDPGDGFSRDAGDGRATDDGDIQATVTAAVDADRGVQSAGRGPFQPLRHADDPVDSGESGTGPQPVTWSGAPEDPDLGDEIPAVLDFGPDDPQDGALDRLRSLYATAETIGPARLDGHFDEVLERQRKLIKEYLTQADSTALSAPEVPAVIGFDSAASLAELRGELRGTF